VESINEFTVNVLTDTLLMLRLFDEFGDGNFSTEIPLLPGKKLMINDTANKFKATINYINNEINALAQNAMAGELSSRIDVTAYKGDWAKLMGNLNGLVATIADQAYWYESILDALPTPLSVTDANMNWTFVNKATEGVLNVKRKDIVGKHCSNWNATICNTDNCGIACFKRGKTQTTFSQGGMYFQVDTADIKDAQGNKTGFVEIVQDITNLETSIRELHQLVDRIDAASDQVAGGAKVISESSMTLATGATDQAATIEELNATIQTINEGTTQNAETAKEAARLSGNARVNAGKGNDDMKQMLQAMEGIRESSNKISSVIKVIEEIAFQTNLLALNAAIEAAHAGVHGRGFTVVANEVRDLASEATDSAKETAELIAESISRVDDGTQIANQTASALQVIVEDVSTVSSLITDIANASEEQALAINQVVLGITQVTEVVQNNSATAEESASAAQELSSQSDILKEMVNVFKKDRSADR